MEAKHVWVNPSTRKLTGYAKTRWREANRQTDRIPMSDVRHDLTYTGLDASKVFRVPLLMVPFWSSTSKNERAECESNYIIRLYRFLVESLDPPANWSALWLLKPELQGPYDESNEIRQEFDTYPAVSSFSFVHVKS